MLISCSLILLAMPGDPARPVSDLTPMRSPTRRLVLSFQSTQNAPSMKVASFFGPLMT
jgi:hypothetical protein